MYAGCILSLLPIYGIQIPIAVALSFLLRANLPILASLQLITNPVTAIPAYFTAYQVGRAILHPFGVESPSLNMGEMKVLYDTLEAGNWGYNIKFLATVWSITAMGGCIIGTFLGALGSAIYRISAYEVDVFNKRLKALQQKRMEAASKETETRETDPSNG